jgi:hypothetical protein
MMGKDLEPVAVKAEGFSMVQEKGGKWGFIATKAGSTLVGHSNYTKVGTRAHLQDLMMILSSGY